MQELIEGIAVEIDSARLNGQRRLQNADDLHEICLGLVNFDYNIIQYKFDWTSPKHEKIRVRIAHFSIQEYLESDRIQRQKAARFSLDLTAAHAEIAQICLIYLLDLGLSSSSTKPESIGEKYPLAYFAAYYWHHHYENAGHHLFKVNDLIVKLFQCQNSLETCLSLYDLAPMYLKYSKVLGNPMYYAGFLGLDQILHKLINIGRQENNSLSSIYDAMHGASTDGHEKTVLSLLAIKQILKLKMYSEMYHLTAMRE